MKNLPVMLQSSNKLLKHFDVVPFNYISMEVIIFTSTNDNHRQNLLNSCIDFMILIIC